MTKTKNLKRAMLMSLLALIVCLSMFVGSTFAWFTDSVTSVGNIIKSGKLDVTMEWADGKTDPTNTTWTDASTGAIFNSELWEPGYVEVRHIKIANAGTLALKYQLNILANGAVSELADVIDVYYVDPAQAVENRDALANVEKIGTLSEVLAQVSTTAAGELEAGENHTITLALKMQETAGNEYQDKSIGSDFSVQLLATQLTSEEDSFDNMYDNLAIVSDAAALRSAIAEGKNVVLNGDVDLGNEPLVINNDMILDLNGNELTGKSTSSTTSYLLKVNSGNALTLKNGEVSFYATTPDTEWGGVGQPAFPGYANNTISLSGTLVVDGATIKNITAPGGASYAIDCYAGSTLIVEDGVVDGCGKVAIRTFAASANNPINVTINGGIVKGKRAAWIQLASSDASVAPIVNFTVNGGTLMSTDAAGDNLALYSYSYGNSFANVNVAFNGGVYYGNIAFGGGTKVDKETVTVDTENCTLNNDVYRYTDNGTELIAAANSNDAVVSDTATLKDALSTPNATVYASAGTYTFPASNFAQGVTLVCDEGTVFEGTSKLNIAGATVVGATFSNPTGNAADQTINGTFKDCTFTGSNGLRWCYAGETVVFENCVFDGSVYGAHFDGGANEVIFKNCTFSGFNAFGGAITKLTLDGCTFKANGRGDYNGVNLWGDTELKNCTFIFDGSVEYEWIDLCGAEKTATVTNCIVTDGTNTTDIANVITKRNDNATIIIDGVTQ